MGNLHIIVVHFPIALLTIYAIFELLPWRRLHADVRYEAVKVALLIIGTITAVVSRQTGEMIAEQFHDIERLLAMHKLFATGTTVFFGLLSIGYLVVLAHRELPRIVRWLPEQLVRLVQVILAQRPAMMLLAVVGLVLITVTGALGGAIAFGAATDPLAQFLYNLLVR